MKHSKPKQPTKSKRKGPTTKKEKAIVAALVKDSPKEITPTQTTALAKMFNRSKPAITSMVQAAREEFQADASLYVNIHREAAVRALATGDFDVARKAAAWAITNVSSEGKRIVDKPESGPSGVQVMVGIKLGGVTQSTASIDLASATFVDAEVATKDESE